jgi:hypothetical protein
MSLFREGIQLQSYISHNVAFWNRKIKWHYAYPCGNGELTGNGHNNFCNKCIQSINILLNINNQQLMWPSGISIIMLRKILVTFTW